MALVVALVTNLVGLVVLVPPLGAMGAAAAALLGSAFSTAFGVVMVSKLVSMPAVAFLLPRRSDVDVLSAEGMRAVRRVTGRGGRVRR